MPYLFNFDAKCIAKLKNYGLEINYSIFSGAWEYPNYALNIIKLGILPFDEVKIANAGSLLHRNESLIKMLVDSATLRKYEDKSNLIELFECIQDFIGLGGKDFILIEENKNNEKYF